MVERQLAPWVTAVGEDTIRVNGFYATIETARMLLHRLRSSDLQCLQLLLLDLSGECFAHIAANLNHRSSPMKLELIGCYLRPENTSFFRGMFCAAAASSSKQHDNTKACTLSLKLKDPNNLLVATLAEVIKHQTNFPLTQVRLQALEFESSGAEKLSTILPIIQAIPSLEGSSNPSSLKHLRLPHFSYSVAMERALADSLPRIKGLASLRLHLVSDLDDTFALLQGFCRNTSLIQVDVIGHRAHPIVLAKAPIYAQRNKHLPHCLELVAQAAAGGFSAKQLRAMQTLPEILSSAIHCDQGHDMVFECLKNLAEKGHFENIPVVAPKEQDCDGSCSLWECCS